MTANTWQLKPKNYNKKALVLQTRQLQCVIIIIQQEGYWSTLAKQMVEGYIERSSPVQMHLLLIAYGDEEYGNVTRWFMGHVLRSLKHLRRLKFCFVLIQARRRTCSSR